MSAKSLVVITVEDGIVISVDGLPPGYGFMVEDDSDDPDVANAHASLSPSSGMSPQDFSISLDGGETYNPVTEDVRVVYAGLDLPGEDQPGELHINLTPEGVVIDLWATRDAPLDHNLATRSQTLLELAEELIETDR